SSRRRHTRFSRDWSSDVCSSDLENSLAAQLIMAAYLNEPWSAVRKVRLFDQDFRRIFNRTVTADRLYLLHLLDSAVVSRRADLRSEERRVGKEGRSRWRRCRSKR